MDAEEFRNMVGRLDQKQEGNNEIRYALEKEENFFAILDDVKVLTRATSDDKLLMVIGLKNCGKTVAVTGDGINDIDALEHADVGLAMGSGCSASKQASSLILTNDCFESAIRGIMWGRNIYHNVGRFLQFQLTVNLSVIFLVLFGILFFGECPLSAVQLLWINLIMDTFAAIALSTEPPLEKILKSVPTSKSTILNATIWRQVLGVSLWNILVTLFLYIFGPSIGGLYDFSSYGTKVNVSDPGNCYINNIKALKDKAEALKGNTDKNSKNTIEAYDNCEAYLQSQAKLKLFTYVFCTFVFSQVFNYFNCRKIGQRELNVFEKLFSKFNIYFWISLAFVCIFQFVMVQILFFLTQTTPLTRSEWGACIITGSLVIPIAALLKLTGSGLLKLIPFTKFIDEDVKVNDGIASSITKISNYQVDINPDNFKGKKKTDGFEPAPDADDNYQRDNNV